MTTTMTTISANVLDTPIGPLSFTCDDDALTALRFGAVATPPPWGAYASTIVAALVRYFDGDLEAVDALRVAPRGTDFQQRVWRALRGVRAGTTTSYGALARDLGLSPGAARAVGMANHHNPIALVVPCHRVLGKDGSLVGYAYGLPTKRWLLDHEAAACDALSLFPRRGGASPRAAALRSTG